MKNYVILRICNKADGTSAIPVSATETEVDAWKEFYRLCGQAVDSTHLTDTVLLLSKEGNKIQSRMFVHNPEPEPEPEPDPDPDPYGTE